MTDTLPPRRASDTPGRRLSSAGPVPLTPPQRAALACDLKRALRKVAPGWTDAGSHDPGTTVLEILAYVLDALLDDPAALDDAARRIAADIGAQAQRLAGPPAVIEAGGDGLERVRYFAGMVLGVDDFQVEQDYLRRRLDRLNRLRHGAGVVAGLETSLDPSDGGRVIVAPGLAIDRQGRELCVERPCTLALPADGTSLFVALAFAERPRGPARIVETSRVSLDAAPSEDALPLARLRRVRGRWRIAPASRASHDRDRAPDLLTQPGRR